MVEKYDIINFLLRRHAYGSYLEVCTPVTGRRHHQLDRRGLGRAHRLMYRCPTDFDDGLPIQFRAPGDDIDGCVAEIARARLGYDLVFVDPFHTYECSFRDLRFALSVLDPAGRLVVHDCNPPDRSLTSPEFQPGPWCGQTFAAFIDLVASTSELEHYTIDTDYGCGIVRNRALVPGLSSPLIKPTPPAILAQWSKAACDPVHRYEVLAANRQQLLNLVSVNRFIAMETGMLLTGES